MKKIIFVSLSCMLALAAGCVSAAKHKELQDENEMNKQELQTARLRISELEGKLGVASTENTKLEGSVAEMQKALEEAQKRKQETEKRLKEFQQLTARFKKLVDAGKLTVRVVNGRMLIGLSTDILFPSGSAKLSPAGLAAIKEVTGVLASLEDRNFQIEGHTDNVPIRANPQFASNWELASARAMTVLNTMLEAGMPANRISAASYGDTQPVASNKTVEGKALNRRIAIVIVPDLSGLPGFEELNKLSSEKGG